MVKEFDQSAFVANIRAVRASANDAHVRDGRVWYSGMLAVMRAHSDETGLTVSQCAAIYAANSINTPWARNLALAAECIADYANGITAPRIRTLGMIVNKCAEILAGNDHDDTLTADPNNLKIKNFRANLSGDESRVTVDRWACRIATAWADCPNGGMPCKRNGRHGCGYVPTGDEYRAMAEAYMTVAAEYGETPAQTQAVTWCVVRGTGE